MVGFTKLFSSITSSSIWNEDDKTRIVWITMLALAGADGVVAASVGGLAHTARVSREDCEKALNVLQSPDPDSRSTEYEGRRIEKVDGGFLLLNYGKYREARSEDERRAYMREYMKGYRKRGVNKDKQSLAEVSRSEPQLAHAEAEEKQTEGEKNSYAKISKERVPSVDDFVGYYHPQMVSYPDFPLKPYLEARYEDWKGVGWKKGARPIEDWTVFLMTLKRDYENDRNKKLMGGDPNAPRPMKAAPKMKMV